MQAGNITEIDWDFVKNMFAQNPNATQLDRPNSLWPGEFLPQEPVNRRSGRYIVIGCEISSYEREVTMVTRGGFRLTKVVSFSPQEDKEIRALLDTFYRLGPSASITHFELEFVLFKKMVGCLHAISKAGRYLIEKPNIVRTAANPHRMTMRPRVPSREVSPGADLPPAFSSASSLIGV